MPELHQPEPIPGPPPMMVADANTSEDCDYALGCECANPVLQIESWTDEAIPPAHERS